MRTIVLGVIGAACAIGSLVAQGDPQPTCKMCPGTYIPKAEVDAYVSKAIAEKLTDQQVRDIEIGKAHVGIGVVHRGKLTAPAPESVAEHDQVSEVYHIMEGTATLMLGPDITGM
jgi:mannose-6-phosphate isomerase-like protein (cupin superfamily)